MDFAKNLLSDNVRVLKSQVSKTAYQGANIMQYRDRNLDP